MIRRCLIRWERLSAVFIAAWVGYLGKPLVAKLAVETLAD